LWDGKTSGVVKRTLQKMFQSKKRKRDSAKDTQAWKDLRYALDEILKDTRQERYTRLYIAISNVFKSPEMKRLRKRLGREFSCRNAGPWDMQTSCFYIGLVVSKFFKDHKWERCTPLRIKVNDPDNPADQRFHCVAGVQRFGKIGYDIVDMQGARLSNKGWEMNNMMEILPTLRVQNEHRHFYVKDGWHKLFADFFIGKEKIMKTHPFFQQPGINHLINTRQVDDQLVLSVLSDFAHDKDIQEKLKVDIGYYCSRPGFGKRAVDGTYELVKAEYNKLLENDEEFHRQWTLARKVREFDLTNLPVPKLHEVTPKKGERVLVTLRSRVGGTGQQYSGTVRGSPKLKGKILTVPVKTDGRVHGLTQRYIDVPWHDVLTLPINCDPAKRGNDSAPG